MKPKDVKFRGKSKHTGEWLYGDLIRNVDGAFAIVAPFDGYEPQNGWLYEVDKKTIGQFTGLQDWSDNDIYEGDIIGEREETFHDRRFLVVYNSNLGSFSLSEIIEDVVFHNELPLGKMVERGYPLNIIGNRWDMTDYANLKY